MLGGREGAEARPTPLIDPDVAYVATRHRLTGYGEQHLVTYLSITRCRSGGHRLERVARIVLHLDPEREPDRARRAWETHLAQARWMTTNGYRNLLRGCRTETSTRTER
ncbi:MAG: DUF2285 domain-containing protein [Mesorhizobium sp.]|nr:MAG: DUF2285 domain-containing protein [Mesorhizobium sp.]